MMHPEARNRVCIIFRTPHVSKARGNNGFIYSNENRTNISGANSHQTPRHSINFGGHLVFRNLSKPNEKKKEAYAPLKFN